MMKFDAGIGGTFSGAPGEDSRPAETSHDSGLIPDGCLSMVSHTSRQEDFCCGPGLLLSLYPKCRGEGSPCSTAECEAPDAPASLQCWIENRVWSGVVGLYSRPHRHQ